MVLAWLVAEKNIALQDAMRFVVGRRPPVAPNARFLCQLAELEVSLIFFEECQLMYILMLSINIRPRSLVDHLLSYTIGSSTCSSLMNSRKVI